MILPETVLQDLRYGLRIFCRNPGFTAVATLALALGIGVNTAVFTAYKAMVVRPLDARNPGEMVNLALIRRLAAEDPFSPEGRQSGATEFNFSYPDYEGYRDSVHSFRGLIAFSPQHMRLSNAGVVVSQRASAAESAAGRLGLLTSAVSN